LQNGPRACDLLDVRDRQDPETSGRRFQRFTRWRAVAALLALGPAFAGCSVASAGVAGIGADENGALVGYVQMCDHHIVGATLDGTDDDALGSAISAISSPAMFCTGPANSRSPAKRTSGDWPATAVDHHRCCIRVIEVTDATKHQTAVESGHGCALDRG
jgi:hypothetical protein